MSRLGCYACLLPLLVCAMTASAEAAGTYNISAREKAACTADAIRFCSHTYPDETQLLSCMKSNRTSLSAICLAAFDAGLKRRHLN